MGHDLQAFIAKDDVATLIQSSREFPFFARLPFGLSLVPVDARWIYDEDERIESNYTALGLPDYAMYGEGGLCMEPVVARVGVDHARTDPILLLKTEWFGGGA